MKSKFELLLFENVLMDVVFRGIAFSQPGGSWNKSRSAGNVQYEVSILRNKTNYYFFRPIRISPQAD